MYINFLSWCLCRDFKFNSLSLYSYLNYYNILCISETNSDMNRQLETQKKRKEVNNVDDELEKTHKRLKRYHKSGVNYDDDDDDDDDGDDDDDDSGDDDNIGDAPYTPTKSGDYRSIFYVFIYSRYLHTAKDPPIDLAIFIYVCKSQS